MDQTLTPRSIHAWRDDVLSAHNAYAHEMTPDQWWNRLERCCDQLTATQYAEAEWEIDRRGFVYSAHEAAEIEAEAMPQDDGGFDAVARLNALADHLVKRKQALGKAA